MKSAGGLPSGGGLAVVVSGVLALWLAVRLEAGAACYSLGMLSHMWAAVAAQK